MYAGLNFVLQNQWQYVQRVAMDSGIYFEPVERALCHEFLPALMGMPKENILGRFCELLSQSIKKDGLGIRNPVNSAKHVHVTLTDAATHLGRTMLDREREFDFECHNSVVSKICKIGLKVIQQSRGGWSKQGRPVLI